jgi:hypothetical protein
LSELAWSVGTTPAVIGVRLFPWPLLSFHCATPCAVEIVDESDASYQATRPFTSDGEDAANAGRSPNITSNRPQKTMAYQIPASLRRQAALDPGTIATLLARASRANESSSVTRRLPPDYRSDGTCGVLVRPCAACRRHCCPARLGGPSCGAVPHAHSQTNTARGREHAANPRSRRADQLRAPNSPMERRLS